MEDSHIAVLDLGNGVSFFGVYDGHGGKHSIKRMCIKRMYRSRGSRFHKGAFSSRVEVVAKF